MIQTMYIPLLKRWNGSGLNPVHVFSWEISIIPGEITFNIAVPCEWAEVLKKQAGVAWGRSSIQQIADPLRALSP